MPFWNWSEVLAEAKLMDFCSKQSKKEFMNKIN